MSIDPISVNFGHRTGQRDYFLELCDIGPWKDTYSLQKVSWIDSLGNQLTENLAKAHQKTPHTLLLTCSLFLSTEDARRVHDGDAFQNLQVEFQ